MKSLGVHRNMRGCMCEVTHQYVATVSRGTEEGGVLEVLLFRGQMTCLGELGL